MVVVPTKEIEMGFLKNMKGAMGQAQDAMSNAGGLQGAMGGMNVTGAMSDRGALESQAHEQNRILRVGQAGTALIRSHVDTGEKAAGNPVWIFDLEVTPEGGAAYTVQHREVISTAALGAYGDGTSMDCRIDPADPQKVAFGDKPWM